MSSKKRATAGHSRDRQPPIRRPRRSWRARVLSVIVVGVFAAWGARIWSSEATLAALGTVETFRNPGCECCAKWVARMKEHGFAVAMHSTSDVSSVKRTHGVLASLESCHTSIVGGYVFEGHVPPDLIERVLRERPAIAGLAVPGMPSGAPGMETAVEPYDVWSFTSGGETALYARR